MSGEEVLLSGRIYLRDIVFVKKFYAGKIEASSNHSLGMHSAKTMIESPIVPNERMIFSY